MEISTTHYGWNNKTCTSSIIDVTVSYSGSTITADVTDLNGKVSKELIESLREVADELEEQNKNIEIRLLKS